jgi:hypothetical protein
MNDQNPLKAHFRQPAIYISLPSGGKFWPEGSLNMPVTGELPVYSMTAADEILLLTPDALINGDATVKLIENCLPNIVNANQTPSIDLETILIAIRIASSGETINISSVCPKCQENQDYDVDLKALMSEFDVDLWRESLTVEQLIFNFHPLPFLRLNDFNNKLFQARKQLSQVNNIEDQDQKEKFTNQILADLSSSDLEFLIDSIHSIQSGNNIVTEKNWIQEFILNCDRKIYSQIKTRMDLLKRKSRCSDISLTCDNCSHSFVSELTLDSASFFA